MTANEGEHANEAGAGRQAAGGEEDHVLAPVPRGGDGTGQLGDLADVRHGREVDVQVGRGAEAAHFGASSPTIDGAGGLAAAGGRVCKGQGDVVLGGALVAFDAQQAVATLVVGKYCSLKTNTVLFEGAVVGDANVVEDGAIIHANVTIWPDKQIEAGPRPRAPSSGADRASACSYAAMRYQG